MQYYSQALTIARDIVLGQKPILVNYGKRLPFNRQIQKSCCYHFRETSKYYGDFINKTQFNLNRKEKLWTTIELHEQLNCLKISDRGIYPVSLENNTGFLIIFYYVENFSLFYSTSTFASKQEAVSKVDTTSHYNQTNMKLMFLLQPQISDD